MIIVFDTDKNHTIKLLEYYDKNNIMKLNDIRQINALKHNALSKHFNTIVFENTADTILLYEAQNPVFTNLICFDPILDKSIFILHLLKSNIVFYLTKKFIKNNYNLYKTIMSLENNKISVILTNKYPSSKKAIKEVIRHIEIQ